MNINQISTGSAISQTSTTSSTSNSTSTQNNSSQSSSTDYQSMLEEKGFKTTGDPNKDAEKAATILSVNVDQAKTILQAIYGDPQQQTTGNKLSLIA
jgi:hypothetical protein